MIHFVSVVIPVKNAEKYVESCIESLLAQSYDKRCYEIIVVDNGSEDNTIEILRRYSQKGMIKMCRFGGHSIASVRNYGASKARGEVIAFLDGDCFAHREWLSEGVKLLLEDATIGCVGFKASMPRDESTWVEKAWYRIHRRGRFSGTLYVGWLSSFNLILWREVFDQAGHFDENLFTCEDVELGRRIDEYKRLLLSDVITIEHKGESKTLWEFFKKEYWHGTSSYMNFKRGPRKGKDYLNIIIPIGYFLNVICFIIACIFSLWYPNTLFFYGGGVFLGFIFLTPLAIVTKLVKYSNSREFLQTAILCSIYLTVRGLAIVSSKK